MNSAERPAVFCPKREKKRIKMIKQMLAITFAIALTGCSAMDTSTSLCNASSHIHCCCSARNGFDSRSKDTVESSYSKMEFLYGWVRRHETDRDFIYPFSSHTTDFAREILSRYRHSSTSYYQEIISSTSFYKDGFECYTYMPIASVEEKVKAHLESVLSRHESMTAERIHHYSEDGVITYSIDTEMFSLSIEFEKALIDSHDGAGFVETCEIRVECLNHYPGQE